MNEWYVALPVTLLLIALSAFFVVLEFSLLAVRRNRLERTAGTSASSRAALRSLNELTVTLAGAQLGITACTFALGAVTKPWVHDALMPLFSALGLPSTAADWASFIVALFIVTFLHLVIGEMAPKSWAITHPESALRLVALPARGFIALFRPLLEWINTAANRLVAATGEQPVERAAARGYDAQALRLLVEHSGDSGALDDEAAAQIAGVIELERAQVAQIVGGESNGPVTLPGTATAGDVQRAAQASGQLRVLLDAPEWDSPRVVHVRDTLGVAPESPAQEQSRPALTMSAATPVNEALETMRREREQLAVVVSEGHEDRHLGILTLDLILEHMWRAAEEQPDRT